MMEPIRFETPRRFQIWSYSVSHGRLLLCSRMTDLHPSRVDVMFYGVIALQLEASMSGVSIIESASTDVWPQSHLSRHPRSTAYRVRSDAGEGWVIASEISVFEDRREDWAPSHFDYAHSGAEVERGTAYQLWWRDGAISPEIVVVRRESEAITVQQVNVPAAILFRGASYAVVQTWLENERFELTGQRGQSLPHGQSA